jgi:hypothetical protein
MRSDRRERYRDGGEDVSYRDSGRRDVGGGGAGGGGRHERTFRHREGGMDGTVRHRDETFRRGPRQESDIDADSYYGDDLMNRCTSLLLISVHDQWINVGCCRMNYGLLALGRKNKKLILIDNFE